MNLLKLASLFSVIFYTCSATSYRCETENSYFHKKRESIIRTEDSIANGAVPLNSIQAESLRECERSCCKHRDCNVALYETTTKNLCYLFDCGPDAALCEFKHHSKYTVSMKVKRKLFHHISGELGVRVITTMSTSGIVPTVQSSLHKVASSNPGQAGASSSASGSADELGNQVRQGGPPPPPPSPPPPPPRPNESLVASLAERYHQARATVIGLGVALALTLVAIVALGCRLRQLRSRFGAGRQGKLRSRMVDDEDYLINGMYL